MKKQLNYVQALSLKSKIQFIIPKIKNSIYKKKVLAYSIRPSTMPKLPSLFPLSLMQPSRYDRTSQPYPSFPHAIFQVRFASISFIDFVIFPPATPYYQIKHFMRFHFFHISASCLPGQFSSLINFVESIFPIYSCLIIISIYQSTSFF